MIFRKQQLQQGKFNFLLFSRCYSFQSLTIQFIFINTIRKLYASFYYYYFPFSQLSIVSLDVQSLRDQCPNQILVLLHLTRIQYCSSFNHSFRNFFMMYCIHLIIFNSSSCLHLKGFRLSFFSFSAT